MKKIILSISLFFIIITTQGNPILFNTSWHDINIIEIFILIFIMIVIRLFPIENFLRNKQRENENLNVNKSISNRVKKSRNERYLYPTDEKNIGEQIKNNLKLYNFEEYRPYLKNHISEYIVPIHKKVEIIEETIKEIQYSISDIKEQIILYRETMNSIEKELSFNRSDQIYNQNDSIIEPCSQEALDGDQKREVEFEIYNEPFQIYYFEAPDPKGWFYDSTKKSSNRKTPSCFYQLTLLGNNTSRGHFTIIVDDNLQKNMLSSPDQNIKPACYVKSKISGGEHIHIINSGVLELEGDKWMVKEKCEIEIIA